MRRDWRIQRDTEIHAELSEIASRHEHVPPRLRSVAWPTQRPGVGAVDADGTLWWGDIAEDFTLRLVDQGLVERSSYSAYEAVNARDPIRGCYELVRLFRGIALERLVIEIEAFWNDGPQRRWMEPVIASLYHLSARGFSFTMVSASPALLLDPVVRWLAPVNSILGLELQVDAGGLLTGEVVGTPTVAEGKAKRLRETWAGPVDIAIGNGILDVALLGLAEHLAWAVNPDASLLAAAERHDWLVTRHSAPAR